MSRSYKKTPYSGDKKNKYMKHLARKRLRQAAKDLDFRLSKGGSRKHSESYDISDYGSVGPSFETFCKEKWTEWEEDKKFGFMWYWNEKLHKETRPTKKDLWKIYSEWYLRK